MKLRIARKVLRQPWVYRHRLSTLSRAKRRFTKADRLREFHETWDVVYAAATKLAPSFFELMLAIGPQRGPASVEQIEAQTKHAKRELE